MILKASSVTNLTDARYFAAKEVDYLGFNLEEGTEGYLDPMYMKAIREWVTGPYVVGEFSSLPIAHVAAAAEFFGLEVVQLSAGDHAGDLAELAGKEVILKVKAGENAASVEDIFRESAPFVSCFVIDFSNSSNWKSILYNEKDQWKELFDLRPTLLQANVSAEQLPELLEQLNLAGLSVVGGEEERVGIKSFDEIEELLEAIGR